MGTRPPFGVDSPPFSKPSKPLRTRRGGLFENRQTVESMNQAFRLLAARHRALRSCACATIAPEETTVSHGGFPHHGATVGPAPPASLCEAGRPGCRYPLRARPGERGIQKCSSHPNTGSPREGEPTTKRPLRSGRPHSIWSFVVDFRRSDLKMRSLVKLHSRFERSNPSEGILD